MKKIKLTFILLLCLVVLGGCGMVTNEIYNKSYNVGEIDITGLQSVVQASIEKVEGSVLGVSNYKKSVVNPEVHYGSGFVYKTIAIMKDGSQKSYEEVLDSNDVDHFKYYLVTNRHVVEGDGYTPELKVYFGEEDKEVDATLIQYDDQIDLAVLTFEHTTIVKPLEFGDSDKLKKGSFAIAIGSPSGFEYYGSATFGIISHPKRYIADDLNNDNISDWDSEYIQHDVAINPGNSGGPLISIDGKVIGINTMKFVSEDIDNMGFSIPSNLVKKIIGLLEKGIKPTRTKLGVEIIGVKYLTPSDKTKYSIDQEMDYGIYIATIDKNQFAYKAGIKQGDIIVKFNDVEVNKTQQIRIELNKFILNQGMSCDVVVLRNGELLTITLYF